MHGDDHNKIEILKLDLFCEIGDGDDGRHSLLPTFVFIKYLPTSWPCHVGNTSRLIRNEFRDSANHDR